MNFVTVMNYDWSNINYKALCYLWIKQAETWLDYNDICIIFSRNKLPKILLDRMRDSKKCRFKNAVFNGFDKKVQFPAGGNKILGENYTYKFYVICNLNFPFIFIDADAFIMSPLTKIKKINENQIMPIICIDHETDIVGHTESYPPFINSGVLLVNDPNKIILNWDLIYDYGKKNKFVFYFKDSNKIIPGTDQAILKSYLDYINYNYTHEEVDTTYNSCAINLNWYKNQDGLWQVEKNNQKINILHYWHEYKPWQNSDCPIFKEVLDDELFVSSNVLDQTR